MNGHSRSTGPYKSPRPAAQGGRVVRVPGDLVRAVRILSSGNADELSYFLCQVVEMGYCASITATSDRGAISITVFDGAIRYKDYARDSDELLRCYRDLLNTIRGEE